MNKPSHLLSLFFVLLLSPAVTFSAPLNLSNAPLYLGGNADPNIMFILDDSGSMQWEVLPDEEISESIYHMFPTNQSMYGSGWYSVSSNSTITSNQGGFEDDNVHNYRRRSSHNNKNYYDPTRRYRPWVTAENEIWPNAITSCAYHNPADTSLGCRDLTVQNMGDANTSTDSYGRWRRRASNGNYSWATGNYVNAQTGVAGFWPATYFVWSPGNVGCNNNIGTRACYTKVEIRTGNTYQGSDARSDCANKPSCTYEEEIQNFANWYTYHRSRVLTSRAGIGRAFAQQAENMRVGFGAINKSASNIDGLSTSAIISGVRRFTGTDRDNFFQNLYEHPMPASNTPLRWALDRAGRYYSYDDNRGPWGETPGTNNTADHLQCRASYTILMTDGYWNSSTAGVAEARANNDGTNGPTITGPGTTSFTYVAESPFSDEHNDTLADVAMYYWKNDLRTDLGNKVPTTFINPAFWQHMVTFGVGLGVTGSIDPDTAFAAINNDTTITWPDPTSSNAAKLDDVLHASVNSRGGFFSASDPDSFAEQLSGVLSNIVDRTSSASSVALNSGSISSDSRVYQARFNSEGWTGQLLALPINIADGTLGSSVWDARDLIPAANLRKIITYDGAQGQPFRWANISNDQQALLISEGNLNYLRGDQSNELSNGGSLRNRSFILGDIINSAPAFVGTPFQRYPDNWGAGAAENVSPYSTFKTANNNRQPLVYVGANDGMLHAFNADTGAEWFAYVPASIYSDLPSLTNPNYTHKYYVDGSPTVVDAFINNQWRTILVSGLGGGGQGIFALDVTNPSDFLNEDTAASRVLWEFTDADDGDLGFTYGQPSIVRLQNGDWAAIFSGGYNNTVDNNSDGNAGDSSTGNAVLFIVRLTDGELIETIDTGVGSVQDPTGQNRPNGLASPAAVDIDGDFIVDYVYAGDLFGNMWKFDLTSTTPSNWGIAYETDGNPQPLFKACFGNTCNSGNIQPITTRPQIVRHPTSNGFLILFGTGKYLEVDDNSAENQTTQTFYAIWDKRQDELTPFNRSSLLKQEITQEVAVDGTNYRVTSDNNINWTNDLGWYIDLLSPNTTNNFGERQVSNSIVRNGRIIFTTLLPSDDPCDFGGSGWLMELNYATGARLSYSPFDITGDGIFNEEDFICIANCELDADGNPDPNRVLVPASGKKSDVGIIPTPSIASEAGGQREFKYTSGSSGNIEVTVENPGPGFEGRQSWRQLDFQFR